LARFSGKKTGKERAKSTKMFSGKGQVAKRALGRSKQRRLWKRAVGGGVLGKTAGVKRDRVLPGKRKFSFGNGGDVSCGNSLGGD